MARRPRPLLQGSQMSGHRTGRECARPLEAQPPRPSRLTYDPAHDAAAVSQQSRAGSPLVLGDFQYSRVPGPETSLGFRSSSLPARYTTRGKGNGKAPIQWIVNTDGGGRRVGSGSSHAVITERLGPWCYHRRLDGGNGSGGRGRGIAAGDIPIGSSPQ